MAIFGLEVVIECDNSGPPPPLSQPGWQRGLHAAQCQRRGPQQVSTSTLTSAPTSTSASTSEQTLIASST